MVDEKLPFLSPRELLAKLCAERNEDFASLSRLIGRNSAYVQQFIRRGTPRRLPERERRILARHFGVAEHLLGADADAVSAAGFLVPPLLDGAVADGESGVAFSAAWLRELVPGASERIHRLRVNGDAMAPTLAPGDELLVDVRRDFEGLRDGLFVLRIEEVPQVRRLTFHPVRREVTVQTDNPAYADWPGLALRDLDLIGRVVWSGRRLA